MTEGRRECRVMGYLNWLFSNQEQAADNEKYWRANHHPVERQGIGQCSGARLWVCWARSLSPFELPGHLPEG